MVQEAKREEIRNKLQQYAIGKRLESLNVALQPASEYYTDNELKCKFKKPKKRVSIRYTVAFLIFILFYFTTYLFVFVNILFNRREKFVKLNL